MRYRYWQYSFSVPQKYCIDIRLFTPTTVTVWLIDVSEMKQGKQNFLSACRRSVTKSINRPRERTGSLLVIEQNRFAAQQFTTQSDPIESPWSISVAVVAHDESLDGRWLYATSLAPCQLVYDRLSQSLKLDHGRCPRKMFDATRSDLIFDKSSQHHSIDRQKSAIVGLFLDIFRKFKADPGFSQIGRCCKAITQSRLRATGQTWTDQKSVIIINIRLSADGKSATNSVVMIMIDYFTKFMQPIQNSRTARKIQSFRSLAEP